jgi:hypothetical protein
MHDHELHEEEFSFKNYFVPLTNLKAIHFIILIGLFVFCNGLLNGFVGDDNSQIINNPTIQSIQNLPLFLFENRLQAGGVTEIGRSFYRPFSDMSYVITYAFFGLNPFFFHLVQLIFFIANACLLFLFFKYFFKQDIAFILALFFLVHPINSETAYYIANMQDVLFLFFGIIALLFLNRSKSTKNIIIVSIFLMFSLFSKETGILFSFVALLYSFLFQRKSFYSLFGYTTFMTLVYAILRFNAIGFATAQSINAPIEKLNLIERLINMPNIALFYIEKFISPINLSSSYQWIYSTIDFNHFFLPLIVDMFILTLIVFFSVYLHRKSTRKYSNTFLFFAVWFLIGILFHLQIFPLDKTVAERWFYFPIIGLLGMIGDLFENFRFRLNNIWMLIPIILILVALSFRTFMRSYDWRDDVTLASHDIKVSKNAYDLYYILSNVYYSQHNYKIAKMDALISVKQFPYITNYTQLGAIDLALGQNNDAEKAYLKATEYGNDSLPYEDLASLALQYGNPIKNINYIRNIALKKYPQDPSLWLDLAILEYKNGSVDNAKNDILQAENYNNGLPAVNVIADIINNNKPLFIHSDGGRLRLETK